MQENGIDRIVNACASLESLKDTEALMEEREREIAKHEAREAFLETAPAIQAEQDAAICELYEMVMEVNNESA